MRCLAEPIMADPSRRRLVLAAACATLAGAGRPAGAEALGDGDIRAAYLFNFIRFIEWPATAFASADAPINVCLLDGRGSSGIALAPLEGKSVGARTIHVSSGTTVAAARQCHVIYVADAALVRLPSLREALGDAPALLVGESDAALDRGAMIGFHALDRRLGFIVNLGATRRAGLRMSPQVLKIALEVRE
jgi:hypothetical protein